VSQVPKSPGQPLVAMTSYSLMYRRGLRQFVQDAQSAGFSGVVVPDLPVEEAEEIGAICRSADFKLILLVTPTTSPSRLAAIVKACTGFVYVVSVVGITGQKAAGSAGIADLIARLRTLTDLPLCVGFGVNTVEQVRELTQLVDGVIVGTALVRLLNNAEADPAAARQAIVDKVGELSAPTRG
jgi:tryptophan synthase alpha chain